MSHKTKQEQALATAIEETDNATEEKVSKSELTPEERQTKIDNYLKELRAIQAGKVKKPQEEKKLRRKLRNLGHFISKVKRAEKAEKELEEQENTEE